MAGGPHAETISCTYCLFKDREYVKAVRTREGLESDGYECERGHGFNIDWSRGEPTKPGWPPTEEELAFLRKPR